MKVLLKAAIFFLVASTAQANCNQNIYDQIYQGIVLNAIKSGLTRADLKTKNDTIENLRALCEGQLSSFETGKLLPTVGPVPRE